MAPRKNVIQSSGELEKMSTQQLVELYNSTKPTVLVKRFASHEVAVRRTIKRIAECQEMPEAKAAPEAPAPKAAKEPKAPKAPKAAKPPKEKKPRSTLPGGRRKLFNLPVRAHAKPHREGTKRAIIIDMLGRPNGASFEEVQAACGWDQRTTYEGIKLVHVHLGYGMEETAESGKIRLIKPSK